MGFRDPSPCPRWRPSPALCLRRVARRLWRLFPGPAAPRLARCCRAAGDGSARYQRSTARRVRDGAARRVRGDAGSGWHVDRPARTSPGAAGGHTHHGHGPAHLRVRHRLSPRSRGARAARDRRLRRLHLGVAPGRGLVPAATLRSVDDGIRTIRHGRQPSRHYSAHARVGDVRLGQDVRRHGRRLPGLLAAVVAARRRGSLSRGPRPRGSTRRCGQGRLATPGERGPADLAQRRDSDGVLDPPGNHVDRHGAGDGLGLPVSDRGPWLHRRRGRRPALAADLLHPGGELRGGSAGRSASGLADADGRGDLDRGRRCAAHPGVLARRGATAARGERCFGADLGGRAGLADRVPPGARLQPTEAYLHRNRTGERGRVPRRDGGGDPGGAGDRSSIRFGRCHAHGLPLGARSVGGARDALDRCDACFASSGAQGRARQDRGWRRRDRAGVCALVGLRLFA